MNADGLIGKVLGTCKLEKLIGQGGMGAVYLAQQSRPRRQVAVKVLLPMTSTASQRAAFLERFRRETDAAASLEHPNIMPVHEYGERDGLAYLVMPYISGGTLRDELERENALSLTKVVNYLEQLTAALDTAHARGVVHRDVKPANILKTPDGRLLLTDFGLVKIAVEGHAHKRDLTGAGVPLGTPDYMAPEQVIGGEVDARADLYSLGVILYQMVTGVTPFRGEMPMQVAMQHLQVPPQSPRTRRPDLPLAAEQVMLRALAKRPADRYVHAQDLASAFRLALTVSGVQLDTPTGLIPAIRMGASDSAPMPTRARSLFDPMWQGDKANHAHEDGSAGRANRLAGKNDIVSKTSMTIPSLSGFLPPQGNASGASENNLQGQAFSATGTMGNTPLPAVQANGGGPQAQPRLMQKPGLLRSMTAFSGFAESDTPAGSSALNAGFPPVPTTPDAPPRHNAMGGVAHVDQMSFSGNWLDTSSSSSGPARSSTAPSAPSGGAKTRQLGPLSPLPPTAVPGMSGTSGSSPVRRTTGALVMPGSEFAGQSTTSMMKLTQPVKMVKVPIAGQPGRYVTGLLPVMVQEPEEPVSLSSSLMTRPLPPPVKRAANALNIPPEKHMHAVLLILAVIVILLGSGAFMMMNSHSSQSAPSSRVIAKATPNARGTAAFRATSTAALRATATAQGNIILIDSLKENRYNWPVFTNGAQISVFKDKAYHMIDNDTKVSATALLPGEIVKNCVYTLTAQEINGDDTSLNNEFGLLMRYGNYQKDGKNYTTFYAFEVANMTDGQYQFLKYDDGADGSPWTTVWSGKFDKEFHSGHDGQAKNTFKVSMNDGKFVFFMNDKQVGTTSDDSLKSGQVGMLVNLKGTEVAFSNLVLTYN